MSVPNKELKTLDHQLLSCVLFKSHIFLSLFLLVLFFQISVVTSIKHYTPGLYLDLSLHWRRLPVLAFQILVVALFFIAIEYLAGFEVDMKRIYLDYLNLTIENRKIYKPRSKVWMNQ